MLLYHAGFKTIEKPDIHYGRKNADFGQGFYLTPEEEFAHRWAGERKGEETVVNTYELALDGLVIKQFDRDREWFEYIYGNRNGKSDELKSDVIIGPIANDIIYNTNGIVTSGFLKPEEAMQILMVGPEYRQITIKTEKAVGQLKWLESKVLSHEEIMGYKKTLMAEETEYQKLLAEKLEEIMGED